MPPKKQMRRKRIDVALVDTRSARLKTALAARDVSARDLAAALAADPAYVSRWVAGDDAGAGAKATTADIARVLRVPVEALEPGGAWEPLVQVLPRE